VEEKREREWIRRKLCCRWGRKEGDGREKKKQRRRMNSFPQGPMHKYRKLQGPVCKTKFPVDLKP
jgi:hypothetical protein